MQIANVSINSATAKVNTKTEQLSKCRSFRYFKKCQKKAMVFFSKSAGFFFCLRINLTSFVLFVFKLITCFKKNNPMHFGHIYNAHERERFCQSLLHNMHNYASIRCHLKSPAFTVLVLPVYFDD